LQVPAETKKSCDCVAGGDIFLDEAPPLRITSVASNPDLYQQSVQKSRKTSVSGVFHFSLRSKKPQKRHLVRCLNRDLLQFPVLPITNRRKIVR